MNLGEILARVEGELQYQPDLLEHRQDFRRVINEVYQVLARERSWPWLWREERLPVLPDLVLPFDETELPSGTVTPVVLVTGQVRRFDVNKLYLCHILDLDTGGLTGELQNKLLAAEFDLTDPTLRSEGNGTWELAPFVIEGVTIVPPSSSNDLEVALDPRCNITAIMGSEGDSVTIRPRRILLPVGLDALDAILDEDGAPLGVGTPREARELLDPSRSTGQPVCVLEDGGHPSVTAFGTEFSREIENWAVHETFELEDGDPETGSIPTGTIVRVFLSWQYAGRLGPPSRMVEFEVPDSGTVLVTGIPVLPESTNEIEYGRRITIWMAEGEGPFFYRGQHTDPTDPTFLIDTGNTEQTSAFQWTRRPRWDEQYPGTYKYVRLYPHPAELTYLTCQFWARARQLVDDTDSPEFHEAYHDLIVWLACSQLIVRYGDKADLQMYAVKETQRRAALDARYFPQQKHAGRQRGMIGTPRRARTPFPPVDWNG